MRVFERLRARVRIPVAGVEPDEFERGKEAERAEALFCSASHEHREPEDPWKSIHDVA